MLESFRSKAVRLFETIEPKRALKRRVERRYYPGSRADVATFLSALTQDRQVGGNAIDIGANSGLFSAPLATVFEAVVAIEPNVERALYLSRALPENVRVLCAAIGSTPSIMELAVPVDQHGNEIHSLGSLAKTREQEFTRTEAASVRTVMTPVTTVDQVCATLVGKISAIKIDVEGFEQPAIEGAADTLRAHRPHLLIELEKKHGAEPEISFSYLLGLGYACHGVKRGKLVPCETATNFRAALHDSEVVNFLFRHSHR